MDITELIGKLQDIKDVYGDIPCLVSTDYGWSYKVSVYKVSVIDNLQEDGRHDYRLSVLIADQ